MNRRIDLHYSQNSATSIILPESNEVQSYFVKESPAAANLESEIEDALNHPFGVQPINDLLGKLRVGNLKVAIIIDDDSRPTPTAAILPHVLDRVEKAGVKVENITIVIALGTHPQMSEEAVVRKVGMRIHSTYPIRCSRSDNQSQMVFMGLTESGVPIYIDSLVAEADFRIGIGSIVPHGAVGWSGGGKIIYPGAAGQETVKRFHLMHGLTRENMKGREDCAVRLEMEQWVKKIGLEFIVNCVLNQNGEVCKVAAGHYIHAQREGVKYAKTIYCYPKSSKYDLVITLSYPHDSDFWLAAKGIYAGEQITRDGGTLILVSPCYEGVGNHHLFLNRCGNPGTFELLKQVLNNETDEPDDVVSLAPAAMIHEIAKRIKIVIVSPGLTENQVTGAGFQWSTDLQYSIDGFLKDNTDAEIGIIHNSNLTFT